MITLAKDLQMPTAAVTQTFAFLGKRGGGKTYAATKLAEEMLIIKAQIIVLDVVGVWFGLRIPRDKRNDPFDIVIFGGLNGDIEIHPKAGKIVADIVLEKNISAVVDISQMVQSEQMRFAYDFLITLFEGRKKKPGACHVFLEEAQELVPQNLPGGAARKGESNYAGKMLNAGERLVKLGRNFGIGCTLISQRPQEVNKKVLNQTEVLLAFQMTGIQEKSTIAEWVRDKGSDIDVKDLLPKLETGQALVWSPTWLKISGTYKISEKITADVSATPEVGSESVKTQKLAPVDVQELTQSIEALTAEMEANTPAALKKRIAELEREVKTARTAIPQAVAEAASRVETVTVEVPVPVIDQEAVDRFAEAFNDFFIEWHEHIDKFVTTVKTFIDKSNLPKTGILYDRLGEIQRATPKLPSGRNSVTNTQTRPQQVSKPVNTGRSDGLVLLEDHQVIHVPVMGKVGGNDHLYGKISGPQQKLLNVLASFEPLGLDSLDRSTLAVFADVSPKSSSFANNLSALKTASSLGGEPLIEYIPGGKVRLTDIGRNFAAGSGFNASSNEDLLNAWCNQLKSGPQSNILRRVFQIYPSQISRGDLAANVEVSETSSSFANNLSRLRTLGLIDYGPNKTVFATDMLFPFQ